MKEPKDYILSVSCGPDHRRESLSRVDVNNESAPALIDGPNFCGYLGVRILDYTGLGHAGSAPGRRNIESEYFTGIFKYS